METTSQRVNTNRSSESLLSIVIPAFQEGSHIKSSIGVIEKILIDNKIPYEFIIVDDGSRDNTWEELKSLASSNDKVTVLRLSRNFGKEAALCAGMDHGNGDMLLTMDADLQHPPELIPEMVRIWREEGYDVVEGIKNSRGKENPIYHGMAKLFYYILLKTADIDLERASDYKLMDRKVVEAWKEMPEKTTFFRGMTSWVGFDCKKISFDVAKRVKGKTKWSPYKLLRLAVNAITSFTSVPLHCITILGLLMLVATFFLGVQTLYMKFSGRATDGFTTVILLLLIIGSSVMVSLGIIGIYLTKIYQEVKGRPRYFIAKSIKGGENK
ncbi:MAG TPA: glycosyltransferase family 2 protein [Clostridiales bacterium]|nr:glycosyltransferase family 2 protein [Clostridiales bacterium]